MIIHHMHISYTVKPLAELTRYVLLFPDVQYFLNAKLCQDLPQRFFGKQRIKGGHCNNSTVHTFIEGTSSQSIQGSVALKPIGGKCKWWYKKKITIVDDTPLTKRLRKQGHYNVMYIAQFKFFLLNGNCAQDS